ncbi:MAG TPA: TetR family transcriptional regulator [Acinetobacter schindleri]|nr:TetR family transcriptional regulator [Acinetobacter schindleri]
MKKLQPPVNEPIIVNGQMSQVWLLFFVDLANAINKLNESP